MDSSDLMPVFRSQGSTSTVCRPCLHTGPASHQFLQNSFHFSVALTGAISELLAMPSLSPGFHRNLNPQSSGTSKDQTYWNRKSGSCPVAGFFWSFESFPEFKRFGPILQGIKHVHVLCTECKRRRKAAGKTVLPAANSGSDAKKQLRKRQARCTLSGFPVIVGFVPEAMSLVLEVVTLT